MTEQQRLREFHSACRDVLTHCSNAAARAYARAALTLSEQAEVKMQALYILTNLNQWRGDTAKQTKAVLTSFAAWRE